MKNKINISVIIPACNRPRDLENCLNSLLNQTKLPYEIIVIDDNSKIDIYSVVKKFIWRDKPKIMYHRNKTNKKSSYCKNKGAKLAKGNVLAFIDDDSVPKKEWIENSERLFISNEIDVLTGKVINLEGRNRILQKLILILKYFPSFLMYPIKFNKTGRFLPSGFFTRNFESNKKQFIDWSPSGNLFIYKKAFNELEGFPEFLKGHLSCEEHFLFLKGFKKIKVLYDPSVEIKHNYSMIGREKRNIAKELENYLLFWYKFYKKDIFKYKIQLVWLSIYYKFIEIFTGYKIDFKKKIKKYN